MTGNTLCVFIHWPARLSKREKASLQVVKLAALLHDIARGEEDASGGKIDHAAQGAKEAFGIMKSLGASRQIVGRNCALH